MKLRIEGNSIRLRVKKSDLEKLKSDGMIGETVAFSDNLYFYYKLKTMQHLQKIKGEFLQNSIQVTIPLSMANEWMDTEQVGIEHTLDSGLKILIEKDFPCKTRDDEDKNDLFQDLVGKDDPSVC
jgi:hypothetical protein